MARTLKLTDSGELHLIDGSGNSCKLKTPASLAGDVTFELPSADGTLNQVLVTNGSGVLSFSSAGSGTISGSGTAGKIAKFTAAGAIGDSIMEESGSNIGFSITPSGAKLHLQQTAAAKGVLIDQNGAALALDIDKAATTGGAAKILNAGTGTGLEVQQTGVDVCLHVNQDAAAIGLKLEKVAGAGDALELTNLGTGRGLFINQDGNGIGLYVDQDGTGVTAVQIDQAGVADGLEINQVGDSIGLDLNKTGTGAGDALAVQNEGSGRGVYVDSNGTGGAILVEHSAAGSSPAVRIDNASVAQGLDINQSGEENALNINKTATGAFNAAAIINAGTGNGLFISQDGNGVGIQLTCTHAGTSSGLRIDYDAGAGNSVTIDHSDTGAGKGILLLYAGSGKPFDTDAQDVGDTTPAFLSNVGDWTNASCWKSLKTDIEPIPRDDFLSKISAMDIKRWRKTKAAQQDPNSPKRLHVFQDDLVNLFDLGDDGIRPGEIASIALVGIQELLKRVEALEAP